MRNSSFSLENDGSGNRDDPDDQLPWRSEQIGAE